MAQVGPISIEGLVEEASSNNKTYLVIVDVLTGFCKEGALASKKVGEVIEPITQLISGLRKSGLPLHNIIFLNDAHRLNAVEFNAFPPHCVAGTIESEVVEELRDVQKTEGVQTFYKNATNALFGKNGEGITFFEYLDQILKVDNVCFLVVGDCTDLCIYQNAMGIQLFANERNVPVKVIVSKAHTRTYHLSVCDAKRIGTIAHDAELLEPMFLYHMMLNGIQVVSDVTTSVFALNK